MLARCVCARVVFVNLSWASTTQGDIRWGSCERGIFDISRSPREIFATVAAVGVCLSRSGLFFGCRPRTELGKRVYLSSVCLLNCFAEFLGACRNVNRISPARRLDRASPLGREDQYLWDHMMDVMMGVSDNHFLCRSQLTEKMFAFDENWWFSACFCLFNFLLNTENVRENPQTQMMLLRCINSFFSPVFAIFDGAFAECLIGNCLRSMRVLQPFISIVLLLPKPRHLGVFLKTQSRSRGWHLQFFLVCCPQFFSVRLPRKNKLFSCWSISFRGVYKQHGRLLSVNTDSLIHLLLLVFSFDGHET